MYPCRASDDDGEVLDVLVQQHLISRPGLWILRAQADKAWTAATVGT